MWSDLRTSSKESLEKLLDKYEETRLQVAQYNLQHQNDIPFAKWVYIWSAPVCWWREADARAVRYLQTSDELVRVRHGHQVGFQRRECRRRCVLPLYRSTPPHSDSHTACFVRPDIIVPAKQLVVRFEIDPATERFEAANALWDRIDEAFEDIDSSL